jgi:hypothetical protein
MTIRRSVGHAAAGLTIVALALPGCQSAGTTAAPYSCGTPQTDNHCYAQAEFLTTSAPGGIRGWRTNIYITNQMGPGDGFIDDEFWLDDTYGIQGWVEVGYFSGVFSTLSVPYYGWGMRATDGIFQSSFFGQVQDADFGNYATFEIQQTDPDDFAVTVTTPTKTYTTVASNSILSDPSNPGFVNMGQELAGSSGAEAGYVLFLDSAAYSGGTWGYYPGPLAETTLQQPPYGGWVATPAPGNQGGAFFTECCINPTASATAAPIPPPAARTPRPHPPQPAIGIPALHPAQPGQQSLAFTLTQATAYALAHPPYQLAVRGKPTTTQARFTTAADLITTIPGLSGLPPGGTALYYVELAGDFSIETPAHQGQQPKVQTFKHAFEIFDARTGNLLSEGGLPD